MQVNRAKGVLVGLIQYYRIKSGSSNPLSQLIFGYEKVCLFFQRLKKVWFIVNDMFRHGVAKTGGQNPNKGWHHLSMYI